MKTMAMLLRRELWENRGSFITSQLAIGGIIVFLPLALLTVLFTAVARIDGEDFILSNSVAMLGAISTEDLNQFWAGLFYGSAAIFSTALFFVVFFYLLSSLSEDRKDRSVLFWKSLPISDLATVVSKYLTAGFVAPVIMVGFLLLTYLLLMVIASVIFAIGGGNIWSLVWVPAAPISVATNILISFFVQAFWYAPIYGWLLLASAFSKSRPFLVAVVPIAVIVMLENWITAIQTLSISDTIVGPFLLDRVMNSVSPFSVVVDSKDLEISSSGLLSDRGEFSISSSLARFADQDMIVGILIGAVFIAAAVWLRRYRDSA